MCGIIGEYRFDKKIIDKKIFKQKLDSINHRGPDGDGIWSNEMYVRSCSFVNN